ncbi:hypothetical protein Adt_13178 [Abeliophyllum distichum]|uniref:Uncharacterized protein n=1 Tax=Abeliophyllum distichum TaxID=126358 RepID=A0ABD1TW20_9LAMI
MQEQGIARWGWLVVLMEEYGGLSNVTIAVSGEQHHQLKAEITARQPPWLSSDGCLAFSWGIKATHSRIYWNNYAIDAKGGVNFRNIQEIIKAFGLKLRQSSPD